MRFRNRGLNLVGQGRDVEHHLAVMHRGNLAFDDPLLAKSLEIDNDVISEDLANCTHPSCALPGKDFPVALQV